MSVDKLVSKNYMNGFTDLPWQELINLFLAEYHKQLIFMYWEDLICQGGDLELNFVEQAFLAKNYSLNQLPYEKRFSLRAMQVKFERVWQENQEERDYLITTLLRYFEGNLAFESCFKELFAV